ncbi:hypothetical protein PoB_006510700 [Plakobranchus ocellatus]|uniref:Uncharacterized protein n=1 Tax=Plakobranchus ocellatus TaxID=259542 RepID=A0AAV4D354_9GAST|nr:hypothetical protein PoB_006510700 [Plakobranchus ocellatus]
MSHQSFIDDFRSKLNQLKSCPALSDDYHLISEILTPCIQFTSHEIIFANIKDRLVPIFPTRNLQHAEASGKGSIDIMLNICDYALKLMLPDFLQLVEAIAEDHFHVAEKLMERVDEMLATL